MKNWSVVCIGDLHFPFEDESKLKKAIQLTGQLKPTLVIQLGDIYDLYSWSRFGRKNFMTPYDEIEKARLKAEKFWAAIQKAAPKAKCIQIRGNHDIRHLLRMLDADYDFLPFVEKTDKTFFEFKNVTTFHDPKEPFEFKDVLYSHGHRKHGDHVKEMRRNVVTGHLHCGRITYLREATDRQLWEMSAGYLGNPYSEALVYRPLNKYFNWQSGIGVVDQYGPRFIHL